MGIRASKDKEERRSGGNGSPAWEASGRLIPETPESQSPLLREHDPPSSQRQGTPVGSAETRGGGGGVGSQTRNLVSLSEVGRWQAGLHLGAQSFPGTIATPPPLIPPKGKKAASPASPQPPRSPVPAAPQPRRKLSETRASTSSVPRSHQGAHCTRKPGSPDRDREVDCPGASSWAGASEVC